MGKEHPSVVEFMSVIKDISNDYYVELCNIRDGKQGVIPRQQPILPNLPDDYKDYVNKSKKTKKK